MCVLYVFMKFEDITLSVRVKNIKRMKTMKINISSAEIALTISFIGLLVSFWNVTRQQKASQKNDELKFIRDLKLKTSDEFIELLYQLMLTIGRYRSLQSRYNEVLPNRNIEKTKEFNEYLWELTEKWGNSIHEIDSYYLKRKKLLIQYDSKIMQIRSNSLSLDGLLWETKGSLFEDEYDSDSILPKVLIMHEMANELIGYIEELIVLIQEDLLKNLGK